MQSNKTAVLTALQTIEVQETPMPAIKADEVLVKMEYCGVCGSDVEFFAHGCIGTNQVTYPFVLGHEVSGIIAEVGDNVANVKKGQSVVWVLAVWPVAAKWSLTTPAAA